MSTLLAIEHLSLVTQRSALPIVDDVSFHIDRGEFLAVVGESGSGKTMIARSIPGLLPPGIVRSAGTITLDGEELTNMPPKRLRALRGPGIGMVFQEPMVSLNPALTVGAQLAEGLRLHGGQSAEEIRWRSIDMLEQVQIRDPEAVLAAYPHEFSGGMRQRLMLASVMLLKPKLLIADEPTTALDTLVQREVLDLMVGLARDHGTAVMLITHNLGLVARYAQRAVVLEKGKLVETGDAQQLIAAPQHPYTARLVDALPRREAGSSRAATSRALISVRGLSLIFPARRRFLRKLPEVRAVDGVDLDIGEGETIAVVGGSGSGKTTLGRTILGLIAATGGEIRYQGRNVLTEPETRRAFRLASQIVFQDPYSSLDPRMRVADIVAEPLRHDAGLAPSRRHERAEQQLAEVGLAGFGRRYPHELSGGQRQRVAIARAIVRQPKFVVADEPVSALDMSIQAQVLGLFRHLQSAHGFACLFISHDLAAVEQIADRVVVMRGGRVIEHGTRDDIFDRPQQEYTKALLEAAPRVAGPAAAKRNDLIEGAAE